MISVPSMKAVSDTAKKKTTRNSTPDHNLKTQRDVVVSDKSVPIKHCDNEECH